MAVASVRQVDELPKNESKESIFIWTNKLLSFFLSHLYFTSNNLNQ